MIDYATDFGIAGQSNMSRWPTVQATSDRSDRRKSLLARGFELRSLGRMRTKRAQRRAVVENEGGRPRKCGLGTFEA